MIIFIFLISLLIIGVILSTVYIDTDCEEYTYNEKGPSYHQGRYIKNYKELGLDAYTHYRCDERVYTKLKFGSTYSVLGYIILILSAIALLGCSIAALSIRTTVPVERRAVETSVKIEEFKDKERLICNYLDGDLTIKVTSDATTYHVIVDRPIDILSTITEYNKSVLTFKQDLYMSKVRLNNPWINWFINPGFTTVAEYNASATSYKDILGENLKLFEVVKN